MTTDHPLDVDLSPTSVGRAVRLVGGELFRSAPAVVVLHMAVVAVSALARPVGAAAAGQVIGVLARGADVDTALVPAAVAGGALMIGGVAASAFDPLARFIIGERFTAALEQRVMRGVGAIPGIAPFEDPDLADIVDVTRWTAGGEFSGGGGAARLYVDATEFGRYFLGAAGAAVVLAQWTWWAPVLICGAEVPTVFLRWRHGGSQMRSESAAAEPYRHSHWFLELGFDPDAGKETRVFGLERWIAERHHAWWTTAFATILADLRRQVRHELPVVVGRVSAAVTMLAFAVSSNVSPGALAAGLLVLPTLVGSSRALAQWPGQVRQNTAHLPKIAALLQLETAASPTRVPRAARGRAGPGTIELDNVTFAYPGSSRPVLNGLTLAIEAGTSLAVVGRNGGGKSTLIKLLCRLHDPDGGCIRLDGVDLREYELVELRSTFGVVFQEFVRFPLSLRANVAVGCVDRPEVADEAMRLAGVARLVGRLPDGDSTLMGREFGGADLSGGEWQRVALARALASRLGNDARVLIADEPTAHMDVRVEHELYRRFAEVTDGRTTILTSHRFSTVRMADRIAVLDKGGIAEIGAHDDLVARGGLYAEMYNLQAQRFRETGELE